MSTTQIKSYKPMIVKLLICLFVFGWMAVAWIVVYPTTPNPGVERNLMTLAPLITVVYWCLVAIILKFWGKNTTLFIIFIILMLLASPRLISWLAWDFMMTQYSL